MDTKSLIKEAKARFNHNAAKSLLKDKYQSKLIVASQNGLWKATPELIGYLASEKDENVMLLDEYENPIMVAREALHYELRKAYNTAMLQWYNELLALENKR